MASALPETYTVAAVNKNGGSFEIQQHPLNKPGPREIVVKVLACGVCRTDDAFRMGASGRPPPHIPGHEIVGEVAGLGSEVTRFALGERVGGTFHGGYDGTCRACFRGQYQHCENHKVTGSSSPGGYGEFTILREEVAVRLPKDADPAEVAPLMCAGLTVFNGIRKMQIRQGSLIAVHGLGGLGHMAVQFASKMGYEVVALSRGSDKRDFAKSLGASHYINTTEEDPAKAMQKLGGVALVVATAPFAETISPLIGGLETGGKLLLLVAVGPIAFDSRLMIHKDLSIHSSLVGTSRDAEETVDFALKNNIKCMIERFPLAQAQEAFDVMMNGKVRFRSVLEMTK